MDKTVPVGKTEKQAGEGLIESDQAAKHRVEEDDQVEKFLSELHYITEEDKKKWFTVEDVAGYKVLKVKPEMFTPPEVKGAPGFLEKVIPYQKQQQEVITFGVDNDF